MKLDRLNERTVQEGKLHALLLIMKLHSYIWNYKQIVVNVSNI